MKVAFSTQDKSTVDAHFGSAENIVIYTIDENGYDYVETITFGGKLEEDGNEDKLLPKVDAVKDCALLYVAAIGGSAAARIIAHNVFPIKIPNREEINTVLNKLLATLRGTPPPWLRKAIKREVEEKKDKEIKFKFEEEL